MIRGFNPRAPYGARPRKVLKRLDRDEFQSTRPVRGATGSASHRKCRHKCFNPRAPYGARLAAVRADVRTRGVSIHAPRTGRDATDRAKPPDNPCFNPRAPYGARPVISCQWSVARKFQSTRPVRGATICTRGFALLKRFQSTRPVRGATGMGIGLFDMLNVSIHAPRTGRDWFLLRRSASVGCFNPRAPYGARRGA